MRGWRAALQETALAESAHTRLASWLDSSQLSDEAVLPLAAEGLRGYLGQVGAAALLVGSSTSSGVPRSRRRQLLDQLILEHVESPSGPATAPAAGTEPPSLAGVSILPWRSRATQDSPHAGDIGMAHPFVLHGERLASRISSVFFTDNVSGSWHHIGAALTPHQDTSALARDHLRRQAAQAVREYSVLDAAAANAALAQPSRECPLEVTGSIHEGRHDVGRSGLVEQQYSRPAVGIDSMHPLEAPDCQAAGHGRNTRSARRLSGRSAHSVGVTIRGRVRVAYSLRRKSCMPLPSGPTNGISPRTREALRTKGRSQTPVDRRRSGRRSCCPHRSTTIAPEGHPAGAA
ncbi:hypothetical protein E5N77_35985 [Streptomyces sp. SS52]|nr:hypothetical protein E5N77_35985 [Streptomyces sp. SS52]